jgi:hypothetical protein
MGTDSTRVASIARARDNDRRRGRSLARGRVGRGDGARSAPGNRDGALHVSASFLDARDFAFDLLYDSNPDALEIVDVRPEDD